MEDLGQAYGYILYRTRLPAAGGELVIDGLHDYARVYVDGRLAGALDRRFSQSKLAISGRAGARLDILVENMGRVNFGPKLRGERKGSSAHSRWTASGSPAGRFFLAAESRGRFPLHTQTLPKGALLLPRAVQRPEVGEHPG